jgi:hypothetical protein
MIDMKARAARSSPILAAVLGYRRGLGARPDAREIPAEGG